MVRLRSFPLLLLCLFASLPAFAATHVWTGATDDHFSNASNWIGGSPAGDASAAISFPASSRLSATNDLNGLTVQSVAFSAGGFTISGNAVTLAANATVIDTSRGANTIACNLVLTGDVGVAVTGDLYDNKGLVLSGVISGSGGITLRGGGHLVYTGSQPNSYSGLTLVRYGELQLKKAPNVTAIAGDLTIENDGFNYEYGYLSIFNDEQIANTSHVTVGYLATLGCGATETLGPVTLTRYSTLQTAVQWSGTINMTGTVIFAGDIDIAGTAQGDIHTYGTFLLQGMRTINATANPGLWNNDSGPGQKTAGSGIILNAAPYSDGTFGVVIEFRQATYDGPTILKSGSVRIDAPLSAVDLQNGRFTGHCKSLTAEGGILYLHGYLGGVTSDGDVKLSPPVTLAYDVGAAMKMNGALDLGGAILQIDNIAGFNYGAVSKVVDNTSTKPVIGTFANLPEGALVANHYKISYAGGDGNDVTLTDVGLVSPNISLDMSPNYPQSGTAIDFTATVGASQQTPTGTVTFSADTTVLGTVPLTNGVAKLSASLPRGHYVVKAAYSGDSRVAPGTTGGRDLYVVTPAPTLTSIDPPVIPAGVKSTLTIHGTNFVDGSSVYFSSAGYAATFVSPTELRISYTPPGFESDYQLDVWVSQPDPYGARESARLKLNVTGGTTKLPSPFTFKSDLTSTLTGVTPGAMTFWFAVARTGGFIYDIDNIVNDTDDDGSVTLPFPFRVNTLPQYGVWLVADLSAHTIFSDNPSQTAPDISPFPPKAFLRDGDGNYTHVQFPAGGSPSMFGWTRPGIGAWMTLMADGAAVDEDSGPNGRVTFETPSMKRTIGTTAPPPADGIRPGDMFLVIDGFGETWWGDAVDLHLSESNGPGKLGFTVASTNALENSGNAQILVERTEGTDGTVTVRYATADGTAIAGKTYAAQAGQLTFAPGEILKTISIPLINDQSYGGGGQFNVTLSSPAGATIGVAAHTVRITDDEQPPVVSLQLPSTSVAEGDAGQIDIPITVKLTGATSLPVTVNWYFSEGSFGGVSHTGELQFAPGETQKTFTASYAANTIPEPNRIMNLHLWNPKNATASSDSVTITIVDDDFAGVSVADASVAESAGSVVVRVQLARSSQKPVTVTYETRSATAAAGADFVTTSGTMTVGQNSSITIPILDDTFHEALEAFEVVLTSVNGGKLERSVGAVIIVDDDSAAPPPPAPPRRRTAPH